MIPSWIINAFILLVASILAIYMGSVLPMFGELGFYLLAFAIVCSICLALNNFPLLLALAVWFPFAPPIPFFRNFPVVALVMIWVSIFLFFRVCLTKKLDYVPSANVFIVLCFLWVPVRFAMSPINKIGSSVMGGHGTSGANAYFLYVLGGSLVVFVGCILNTRYRLVQYMRWQFRFCLGIGAMLLVCAFLPPTWPYLTMLGMYSFGTMGDGILRLVALPGYGLILVQSALCPALFRLTKLQSFLAFGFGWVLLILGGNRSAVMAVILVVPVIFLLRKKMHALMLTLVFCVAGIGATNIIISQMDVDQIPTFARSLGMFNSKIDKASGGDASAEWRYELWQDGINKIKEAPLMGKGFGNLDKRMDVDANGQGGTTDFESRLAAGLAHNGFISAAYGFGIPFMVAICSIFFFRMLSHAKSAFEIGNRDTELRDFHAFLASSLFSFSVLIYTAFDLCTAYFWIYVGMGLVMDRLTRRSRETNQIPSAATQVRLPENPAIYPGSLAPKH